MGYRETVRMLPVGAEQGILGRAVNLSPAGILVDAPTPIPVGAELLCDLDLPDGAATLRGRVARLQELSGAEADAGASVGVGIAFVDLSTHDASALRRLVDERDRVLRVAIRFEGLSQPVRSTAALTDDGFRLTTPLPFLRLGSSVEVATSADARVFARGVVRRVVLQETQADGVPRLLVELGLAAQAGVDEGAALPGPPEGESASPAPPPAQAAIDAGTEADERLRAELNLEAEEWDPHTVSLGRLRLLRPPPALLVALAAAVVLVVAATVAITLGLRNPRRSSTPTGAGPRGPMAASLSAGLDPENDPPTPQPVARTVVGR